MLQANGIQCFETIARAETVQFNLLTITMQIAHITNALGFFDPRTCYEVHVS